MKKNILILLMLTAQWLSAQTITVSQEPENINYFSRTTAACWDNNKSSAYFGGGATVETCNGSLPVQLNEGDGGSLRLRTSLTSGYWNIFIRYVTPPIDWRQIGTDPVISIRLRWAEGNNDFNIGLQGTQIGLRNYVNPSANWQIANIPVSDFKKLNPTISINSVGGLQFFGTGNYAASTVYIDYIKIIPCATCKYSELIKVNQVGYLPNYPKVAVVSYITGGLSASPTQFRVINSKQQTVFSGTLTTAPSGTWKQTNDVVQYADFSNFKDTGTYHLYLPEMGISSFRFRISDDVMDKPYRDALRFFYYARSGVKFEEPYAEGFLANARNAGDVAATFDYKTGTRDVNGGWHDAGDPHKDVHNQIQTQWFLLETIKELKSKTKAGLLNLPESDGKTNDILLIEKWGLDWLNKMWNPDGSVLYWIEYSPGYFNQFAGKISNVSTGSASTLAGIFAKAYTIYKNEPGYAVYADTLLARAKKSWDWLQSHPTNIPVYVPGTRYDIADNEDQARRAFAAVELFNATGEEKYNTYFTGRYTNPLNDYGGNLSWAGIIQELHRSSVNCAYLDYANSTQAGANKTIQQTIQDAFKKQADWILNNMNSEPYRPPVVATQGIMWGSNWLIAANAKVFYQTYQWTKDIKYLNASYDCIQWVLGRNPVNYSMITGNGTKTADFWTASGYWDKPGNQPPGYFPGGINTTYAAEYIDEPFKRFPQSWDAPVLEPVIDGNAKLVFMLGYFATDKIPAVITNLEDSEIEEGLLSVYPNPANNYIMISPIKDNKSKASFNVQITNSMGQIVHQQKTSNSDNHQIEISQFPAGLYFIKAGDQIQKFIKQ